MSGRARAAGTLGDLLAARRRGLVVGREEEVRLLREALAADPLPFAVLHLHGPGGIGKTTLLDVLAEEAAAAGATVVRLDGRTLPPSRPALAHALAPALDAGGRTRHGRTVLLLDAYEHLAPLDDWIRTEVMPALPASTLAVLAGRLPPRPAWCADPAWRGLLRAAPLRNLPPRPGRRYLEACGVPPGAHDRVLAATHGHPLALSLVADVAARGGDVAIDPLDADVVGALLRRLLDAVPDGAQRRALGVCALARATTEPLLREALGVDDAHDLFLWLAGLSFVERGPEGLQPHDLARDVVDRDLRWRDPEEYARVFRAVRAHVHGRLRATRGREQQRAILDEKYLFRNLPSILSPVDWGAWGRHLPEPAGPEDAASILDLVATAEGPGSAAIAERWLGRQPHGFSVIRQEDGAVRGVLVVLDLSAAAHDDRAADPGAAAAWAHASRTAAPRAGETVLQLRLVVDREAGQGPSPTLNAAPVATIQRYLRTPRLAWDFITLAEPDAWNPYFAVADFPRAPQADFELDGRRYGLFAHDFRPAPVDAWLELVTERALAQDLTLPAPRAPTTLAPSEPDFADAVRQALRDLHRPELLARNPLLRTGLARRRAGGGAPGPAHLEDLVREAVETLRRHPRDDRLLRAVERTYVVPAPTREAAAQALGLPFSTYRRHLAQGLARVVSWLWEQEIDPAAHPEGEQG